MIQKTYKHLRVQRRSCLPAKTALSRLQLLHSIHTSGHNRPFSYSTNEPGSSVIFVHLYTRGSIEWRQSFYHNCAHSKILQNVAKFRSILILFGIAKRSILGAVAYDQMNTRKLRNT